MKTKKQKNQETRHTKKRETPSNIKHKETQNTKQYETPRNKKYPKQETYKTNTPDMAVSVAVC